MLIKTFVVGQLSTNCYVVTDEKTLACAVIDPGAESGTILNYIDEHKLTLRCVFLTHGHFDHTTAVKNVVEGTDAVVFIHEKDTIPEPRRGSMKYVPDARTRYYADGDKIQVGSLEFEVLETPGHSAGSVTLRCEDVLFTGDTLFRDSCGRTDLEDGSMEVLQGSLRRLYALEGDYEVYPGHADATTLARERRFNYYMRYAVES